MKKISVFLSSTLFMLINAQLSPEKREQLIRTYAPLIKLHDGELSSPTSVPWYVTRCALKERTKEGIKTVIKKGELTVEKLGSLSYEHHPVYFLDPEGDKNTLKGEGFRDGFAAAECYVNVVEKNESEVILQYWFFYAYQDAVSPNLGPLDKILHLFDIGIHEGDWEHLNIYLKSANGTYVPKEIFYARHNQSKGKLKYINECKFVDHNLNLIPLGKNTPNDKQLLEIVKHGFHPVAYAAKNSHANYSEVMRNLDFDATNDKGNEWKCWEHAVYMGTQQNPAPGQSWINFVGRWGSTIETSAAGVEYHGNSPETPPRYGSFLTPGQSKKLIETKIDGKEVNKIPVRSESYITKALGKSKRHSPYFDLYIPSRIRTLEWVITTPQNIQYEIWEKKTLRPDKKQFGPLHGNKVITKLPSDQKNLYIANIKIPNGDPLPNFSVQIWGIEE